MLQLGVNSEPPSIDIKKLVPIPEIICSVNEDVKNITKYSKSMDPLVKSMKEYADISTKMWQDGGLLAGPENMLNQLEWKKIKQSIDKWLN